MRASRWQQFRDTTHSSPRARQGVGRQALKQLNTTTELSKEREDEPCEEKYFLVSYSGNPQCLL
jgi:hypothetical protein